jgi:hypothetical protein
MTKRWWTEHALDTGTISYEGSAAWLDLYAAEDPPYKITGKYLFYVPDPWVLLDIALLEIRQWGFHRAKISTRPPASSEEYVLCLYYRDDSRRRELAQRWAGRVKYRWWKSDALTGRGVYGGKWMSERDIEEERTALLAHLTAQGFARDVVEEAIGNLFGPYTILSEREAQEHGIETAGWVSLRSGEIVDLVHVHMPRDRRGRWMWWAFLNAGPNASQLRLALD